MATALRPIKHEDRLSLVEHLDELRTRLVLCAVTLVVAFGLCFWQNGALLSVLNKPLQETSISAQSGGRLSQASRQAALQRRALEQLGGAVNTLAQGAERLPARTRAAFQAQLKAYNATVARFPVTPPKRAPVTLGVAEPFTTTLSTSFWFALIFSLPVILYQLYAFVLPAFSPRERAVAMPLMAMIPVLFVGGVLFGYFLVLPPAIGFLQHFNDDSFDVLVHHARHRPDLPGADRHGRTQPGGDPLGRAPAKDLALRGGDHRGRRGAVAGGRSGHHPARDGPPVGPLPAEYPAPDLARPSLARLP